MAADATKVVRDVYDAWNSGETALDMFDPAAVYVEAAAVFGGRTVEGIDELAAYIESVNRYWEDFRFEPLEVIDVGERVVAVVQMTGIGGESGVAVERKWGHLWTVRSGKVTRLEGYGVPAEAFAAAGLTE
jgi:ketosteroid isomerase-like protein